MESKAEKIVEKMYHNDWFSQWLGIKRIAITEGKCVLTLIVRKEMLNGFGILHGGITYSLADSALAFASNSYGKMAVSIETSISHIISCKEGDVLTATTIEINKTNKIGIYSINVTNQNYKLVASFKGTVYVTEKDWLM